MLDTNQIAQLGQTAQVIKAQINPWLPAIAIAAAWLGRELNRFIIWANFTAEKIIAHGGLIKILCKLFWNSETGTHTNRPTNI
jgi:hypothetical protein